MMPSSARCHHSSSADSGPCPLSTARTDDDARKMPAADMIHRLMHIKVVCYVDISHAQKSSGGGGIYIDVDFYAMSSWCKDAAWARAYAPTDPVADVDDEELSGSSVRALPFFLLFLSFTLPADSYLFIWLRSLAGYYWSQQHGNPFSASALLG